MKPDEQIEYIKNLKSLNELTAIGQEQGDYDKIPDTAQQNKPVDDALVDIVSDYVVDYPRFEETANEVAELILERVVPIIQNDVLDRVEINAIHFLIKQFADWERAKGTLACVLGYAEEKEIVSIIEKWALDNSFRRIDEALDKLGEVK